ncbi:hypothetical protein COUCH_00495 [Couchioplanes caeruleus]|uniref:hypothetical protein n=1 Tax=Couchioplanes caeruleus TaxID=56438 RepID=UPI0020BD9F12|nr:hypothetical protein [Couchioplanes caeruleus]UQU64882.1 hypothetical protein COUCH_00495 [Couchioplanes caeruleus]
MHSDPLTRAMWRAHDAAEKLEGTAPSPEAVEQIAKAAVAGYLDALAAENKVRTGHTAGIDGGDSWAHRPIYSPDLARYAEQAARAPFIGPSDEPFGW